MFDSSPVVMENSVTGKKPWYVLPKELLGIRGCGN